MALQSKRKREVGEQPPNPMCAFAFTSLDDGGKRDIGILPLAFGATENNSW
jgi:hypothetical protein